MAARRLSEDAQRFIVQQLACFRTPSAVATAVHTELGVEVSRQAVQAYDPTKVQGARLSAKWRTLFDATRAAYLAGVGEVAVAHRRYRLERLQEIVDDPVTRRSPRVVMAALAEAREEAELQEFERRLARLEGRP